MSLLINDSPLSFSAQLAQTIGLEEAILLQVLHDFALLSGTRPTVVRYELLLARLAFWQAADIQRISKSLADKGVIHIMSAPFGQQAQFEFAFDAPPQQAIAPRQAVRAQGANRISPYWQPDETVLQQLAQHQVPLGFIREQVNEFVMYWQERGDISHSWQAKFYKQVLRAWQTYQSQAVHRATTDKPQPLQTRWQPSQDALQILVQNGINARFIEDAIPEFILYWQEKGTAMNTWNSLFIQHVKRQWARYTSSLKYDTEPRRIAKNWQPSKDVYDILRMANIPPDFANQCISEFVLYWLDSNQLHSSWNTKFLQHVKYRWANQHQLIGAANARQQNATGQPAAPTSFIEKHTDRSWAE